MNSLKASIMPWIVLAVVVFGSIAVNVATASSDVKRNFTPDEEYFTLICPEIKDHVTGEVRVFTKDNKLQVQVTYVNGDERVVKPPMFFQYTLMGVDSFSTDTNPNKLSPNAHVTNIITTDRDVAYVSSMQKVNGELIPDYRPCFVK